MYPSTVLESKVQDQVLVRAYSLVVSWLMIAKLHVYIPFPKGTIMLDRHSFFSNMVASTFIPSAILFQIIHILRHWELRLQHGKKEDKSLPP